MGASRPTGMTLDANIIIAFLSGESAVIDALTRWRQEGRPLFLSTVVETEVLSFSGWTSAEKEATERFLEENFTSISFDRAVASIAAQIRREQKRKFPDAAIAATALFTHTPLVTRNVKDFKGISGLTIVTI